MFIISKPDKISQKAVKRKTRALTTDVLLRLQLHSYTVPLQSWLFHSHITRLLHDDWVTTLILHTVQVYKIRQLLNSVGRVEATEMLLQLFLYTNELGKTVGLTAVLVSVRCLFTMLLNL